MDIRALSAELAVAPQIAAADMRAVAEAGFRSVLCNRPDGEGADQPVFSEIERAGNEQGLQVRHLPAVSGKVTDQQGQAFGALMSELPKPVLAFCRTGMRSTTMWALWQSGLTPQNPPLPQIIERAARAGFDLKGVVRRIVNGGKTPVEATDAAHDILIIGGGAAGISVAASLLARSPKLDIAIIDPADIHRYQPGWTMVGAGLFDAATTARTIGVAACVPALMENIEAYGIGLNFGHTLVSVDGPANKARFSKANADGTKELVTRDFDMLHVVLSQTAPDFVRVSPMADATGWVEVDPGTLRHKSFANVFTLGDAANTPNAKTAAAARKQAPVVAHNLLVMRGEARGEARYDGYGSCPLTVERGKIVLAAFLYGGKIAPSFPRWLIDGTRPSALARYLKERVLPPLYWNGMLKGSQWMAHPEMVG